MFLLRIFCRAFAQVATHPTLFRVFWRDDICGLAVLELRWEREPRRAREELLGSGEAWVQVRTALPGSSAVMVLGMGDPVAATSDGVHKVVDQLPGLGRARPRPGRSSGAWTA